MKTLITQPTELQLNPRPNYTELISRNGPVFFIYIYIYKSRALESRPYFKRPKLAANAKQIFRIDLT